MDNVLSSLKPHSHSLSEVKRVKKYAANKIPVTAGKLSNSSFLTARSQILALRRGLISRPRLNVLLDEMLDYRLTLLVAPAGYGKTTAIVEWAKATDLPIAWLTLDCENNTMSNFWQYFYFSLTKLLTHDKRIDRTTLNVNFNLKLQHSDQLYFQKTLSLLMSKNALEQLRTPNNFIFVLDDFQMIEDPLIQDSLQQLIRFMPENMHLVIISRTEPHLSLSKFRAKGFIREFTTEHLRFQCEEIDEYFRSMDYRLTAADLQKIEAKTKGWIVALYFMALTLREYDNYSNAVDVFNGNNHYLTEYFAEEILGGYSVEIRTFLVQTSILERLSAPLCDTVTERRDSAPILRRLLNDHFLLYSLDQEKRYFKYHPLLAGYLQTCLRKMPSKPQVQLCVLAGHWCENKGLLVDAIEYYIKAGDHKKAVILLTQELAGILYREENERYLNWIAVLPETIQRNHLSHCLAHAYIMLLYDRLGPAEKWINFAENCLFIKETQAEKWDIRQLQGEVNLLKANLDIKQKKYREAIHLFVENLKTIHKLLFLPTVLAGLNKGEASLLGTHFGLYGRLRDMEKLYQSTYIEIWSISRKNTGYVPVAIAEVLYEQNRIDEAIPYLELGMEEAQSCNNLGALVPALFTLSRIKKVQGNQEVVLEIIDSISYKWRHSDQAIWQNLISAFKVRFRLERNDLIGSDIWLENSRLDYSTFESGREYEFITYVRLLREQQHYEEALFLLTRLALMAEKKDRISSMIEIYNLTALVYQEKGEPVKAMERLRKSLVLGEKHGYLRRFVDEGAGMLVLLNRFCQYKGKYFSEEPEKTLMRYARNLFRLTKEYISRQTAYGLDGEFSSLTVSAQAVQLTRREQEVLQHIAQEMTNLKIAQVLGISCQAVKIHASNVYAKLGVKNRMQAIRRGRELKILT